MRTDGHSSADSRRPILTAETAEVLEGRLPRRARSLVTEWAIAHRAELRRSWELARASQRLPAIEGLD